MKLILYVALLFTSALAFAQDSGSISGNVLDFESSNQPLTFAKVSIKETGKKVLTDENGYFLFKNLNVGDYTLVISFIGYDTKTLKIKATYNTKKTAVVLEPSTISLDDFIATMASTDSKTAAIDK